MATAYAARAAPVPATGAIAVTSAPGAVRLGAFAALCTFTSLTWAGQLHPADRTAALLWTAVAVALAAGCALLCGRASRTRAVGLGVALPAVVVVLLPVCHVSLALLRPGAMGELLAGVGQGLSALPDLKVPYKGLDEWVRTVVLAGGALLALLGALLACWPGGEGRGHPLGAAGVLALMYAVPVVEHGPDHPFASGALFTVLLGVLIWGERLVASQLPLAVALTTAAVVLAVLVAPRLDGRRPWLDYQHLGDSIARSGVGFDWSHRYTPLSWPRDGREALRIKAPSSAYWKGYVLDDFDGVVWRHSASAAAARSDTEVNPDHPEWIQQVRVVARSIRSRELYAPGDVLRIDALGRAVRASAGGTYVTAPGVRPLHPADSYRATVYSPRPSSSDMRGAGTDYPAWLADALQLDLPARVGGPALPDPAAGRSDGVGHVRFPFYGTAGPVALITPANFAYRTGRSALLASAYGPLYRLVRRLSSGSISPYDFVTRVQRRVRAGATYTESPPRARLPLADFVLGARRGYCQQFSGAMALMLRMGGVPARVAAGFAPGVFDRVRHEYVARDLDAHSWVEVYFPRIGWVAFDPTPASAPPASQSSDSEAGAATGSSRDPGGDLRSDRRTGRAVAHNGGTGSGDRLLTAALALFAAGVGAATALVVRAHRRAAGTATPPELADLVRALRQTGRSTDAALTLAAVELRLDGDLAAQGYVRSLRARRYGATGALAAPPTASQRRALRRALAAGLGPVGRIRAWLALPPRLSDLRDRS